MGPVVDQSQLDQDLRYLDIGREEGADLVFGGERLQRATPGFYLSPALFTGTRNHMRINREVGRTAAELLASVSEDDLRTILRRYGEEKRAAAKATSVTATK